MTPAKLAEYFELAGARVLQTASCYWYEVEPRVFNSIPFHREVAPSDEELSPLWKAGAVAARHPSGMDSPIGSPSVHYVCVDKQYSLARVPSANTRNHIRRGQKECTVRELTAATLRDEGWVLHEKTVARQRRLTRASEQDRWGRQGDAMERVGGFDCFGAFVGEKLAALAVGFLIEDCYQVSTVRSDPDYFRQHPNDVLIHHVLVQAMARPEVSFASYGFESIRADTLGLRRFKLGLGFEARPVMQSVRTRTWIRPMLPGLRGVAKVGTRLLPHSAFLSQLERTLALAAASVRRK